MDMIELVKNTLEIGESITVQDSPFTQIPHKFAGKIITITDDIFIVETIDGLVQIDTWSLGLAIHHGEITII